MTFQTQRPTVEALERLMFKEAPILDHGFIRLIDYMGDESAIVQAARVSYGKGTKTESLDEGLIRYLLRARHTTPFEMCQIKFHIKMPIFVARQWIRHRMACLGSQTVIQFDEPAAVNGGSRKRSNTTIGELFRLWSQGTKHILPKKKPTYTEQVNPEEIYTIPELSRLVKRREETLRNCIREGHLEAFKVEANSPREPVIRIKGSSWHEYAARNYEVSINMKPRIMKRLVRCVNEETGEVSHTKIVNVWESGEKEVFHVKMENGNWFECSQDHLILTPNGMKTLKELTVGSMAIAIVEGNGTNEPFDHEANPENEIWKSVLEWEAYYEVSNHGRVRRIGKGKGARRMKPTKGTLSKGRRVVNLNLPGKQTLRQVAHLVAEAFIGPRPLGLMCCHNDGNSLNNWADNLRWGTPKSNGEDMVRDGMSSRLASKAVPIASITSIGTQMTYDMEVEGPWHNFSAGGVIVHNSVNEYSARYSILDREFYLPEPEVLAVQSKTNKQGRGEVLTAEEAKQVLALLHRDAMRSYDTYEELLNDQGDGTPKDESLPQVARELARMNLSLNFYTQWYWKIDLHNLMHFLGLRMDAHAQYEIRVYANRIGEIVEAWVPHVWKAFEDYRLGSASFSRPELEALRLCFQEAFTTEQLQATRLNFRAVLKDKGCSTREIKAFMTTLGLAPKE